MRFSIRSAILLAACMLALACPSRAQAFQSYFTNNNVEADTVQMFPKWTGMLSRYKAESRTLADVCGEDQYSPCKLKEWKDFLESQRGKPLEDQIDAVNRFVNKYPYIEDIVNWGVQDYWETPYEFQRRNGDCEDFAIAKFVSLRALGITGDVLRVAIVRDMNLRGIIHAVLIVFVDENQYVLDNQIKQVVPATKIYHYIPVYAINEKHWWKYLMSK